MNFARFTGAHNNSDSLVIAQTRVRGSFANQSQIFLDNRYSRRLCNISVPNVNPCKAPETSCYCLADPESRRDIMRQLIFKKIQRRGISRSRKARQGYTSKK